MNKSEINKMNKHELCKKANELGIYGFWLMTNLELRKCIKKALDMTKEEIMYFSWVKYIQGE